jgi:hypothetical protein
MGKWAPNKKIARSEDLATIFYLERETGFEPATSTLARSHSTTELFPLSELCLIANPDYAVKQKTLP